MAETTFKVHIKWDNEEELAERLAHIVGYDSDCKPFKKDSGYRWALNGTNNWWFDKADKPLYYKIAGRYASQEVMDALKIYLEYVFQ
jgi:hypothetical protein